MELRHLEYFAMVASELHFRKAAQKLFISQPPLSRQIKELEEELGTQLFIRSNKKVELTDAGKYLKQEVETMFKHIDKFKRQLKYIGQQTTGQFKIGYISSTYHDNLMQMVNGLADQFPLVKTQLFEVPTIKQINALEVGKLDIGIMRAPVFSDQLSIKPLFKDPFVLVTNEEKQDFDLSDFKDTPFIFFNKEYAPEFHSKLIEICNRSGFTPDVVHEANNVHSILKMVMKKMGVSILPKSVAIQSQNSDLKYYNIAGNTFFTEVVAAWKNEDENPALSWFINQLEHFTSMDSF